MNAAPVTRETENQVVIEGRLDAPLALVWEAFTDPAHVKNWYGGHGFENPLCEMDVRPGGLWKHVMKTPDGQEVALTFRFVEVDAPRRLAWETVTEDTPLHGQLRVRHVLSLTADGAATRTHFVASFGSPAALAMARSIGFEHVIAQGTERMRRVLETLKAASR
ncbi:MAG: Activator of Hsp90 ATPase 1 family protein [Labilithrix sp.]|nr:Activator of Hsp90 ATPase 1 family protein [Labilithrix sp.]